MAEVSPEQRPSSRLLVKDVLQKTTQFFREKGIETARLDAELLIAAALGWERMKIYLNYDYPLNETELGTCREYVRRRSGGEPVAYILGKKGFYNHDFKVTPAVLIPRPETEQIVEETVAWMRANNAQRVVDFGTGSGCLGLSILGEVPEARLVAVDISSAALEIAKENAQVAGLSERAVFVESDVAALEAARLQDLLTGPADAVVANPPYIAENDPEVEAGVRKFEPSTALFSPDEGLAHIRAWCLKAGQILRPGGWVMFEIGHLQGPAAKAIFNESGNFEDVSIEKDLSGRERYIRARRR